MSFKPEQLLVDGQHFQVHVSALLPQKAHFSFPSSRKLRRTFGLGCIRLQEQQRFFISFLVTARTFSSNAQLSKWHLHATWNDAALSSSGVAPAAAGAEVPFLPT
jgi:hypothetical protein